MPVLGNEFFTYAYSAITGLPSTLKFPTSASPSTFQLTAAYNYTNGILSQIVDAATPSTIWWQANSTNPRGQITQETTEDLAGHPQIVSNHVYDAVTGWLSANQTGVGTGAALQNESYLYDEDGNVIQRQNNNLGLTESFSYDQVNRLSTSHLGTALNLSITYDLTGNIVSRNDVASGSAWTYDPTHKHQVTQAGSPAFSYGYDANGNVISRNGSLQTWTSYNYPSGVTTATESATFDYGPNRQRWRMIYSGTGGTETTYYATPAFEAVVTSAGTDYRHYISANGRPVVVVSRTTAGAISVHSLLTDQQGSVAAIVADATGTTTASESFTPYGNRREAATWSGSPTSAELSAMNGVTREGYTFQTVLGSMGLSHMNGRIEDTVTGRFLSADPHGISQRNTQSFNRYTYVQNNPLTFVDPTGFRCEKKSSYGDGGSCVSGLPTPSDLSGIATYSNPDGGLTFENDCQCSEAYRQSQEQAQRQNQGRNGNDGQTRGGDKSDDTESSSSLGDFLRGAPLVGDILGGIGDILSGAGNILVGNISTGFGEIGNGLEGIADGTLDLAGKVWTFPNTAVGLIAGLAGIPFGASISLGNNSIQFLNYPWGTGGAITLGNVQLYNDSAPNTLSLGYDGAGPPEPIGSHEEGHTYQYQLLGPLFGPVYGLSGPFAAPSNPFEQAADAYSRGKGWWPW